MGAVGGIVSDKENGAGKRRKAGWKTTLQSTNLLLILQPRPFQAFALRRSASSPSFDTAALVEVIEHLDKKRLAALEAVVLGQARPAHVLVTTPTPIVTSSSRISKPVNSATLTTASSGPAPSLPPGPPAYPAPATSVPRPNRCCPPPTDFRSWPQCAARGCYSAAGETTCVFGFTFGWPLHSINPHP